MQFFDSLEVSLEVSGYNSKVYYIVTQGAGFGDGVYRFPITGNETVLDAISQINGLQRVSSKKIWVARPTDNLAACSGWRSVGRTSLPTPTPARISKSFPATAFSLPKTS